MNTRILRVAPLLLALAGCSHLGTEVAVKADHDTTVRAVDQEVISVAIDDGFDKLKLPAYRSGGAPSPAPLVPAATSGGTTAGDAPPPAPMMGTGGASLSGYVVVASSLQLPDALRSYIAAKATTAAGNAGLGVREVTHVALQMANGTLEQYDQFPDTDVLVVVSVTYAGVDDVSEPLELRHTVNKGKVVAGRFKATFAVVPRKANVSAYTEVVQGQSRFDLDDQKYFDGR